jgi:hypothetical protein
MHGEYELLVTELDRIAFELLQVPDAKRRLQQQVSDNMILIGQTVSKVLQFTSAPGGCTAWLLAQRTFHQTRDAFLSNPCTRRPLVAEMEVPFVDMFPP